MDDPEFETLVQSYLRNQHYSDRRQTVIKIFHSVFNASFVLLPFAACQTGFVLFLALLIGASLLSAYTSVMVVRMANENNKRTFEGLVEKLFGVKGYVLVCSLQSIFSLILMCMALEVWTDISTVVLKEWFPHHNSALNRHFMCFIGGICMLPPCVLSKSMVSLSWLSFANIISVVFSLVVVIISFSLKAAVIRNVKNEYVFDAKFEWWSGVFILLICFSYTQKVFPSYNCLRARDTKRWRFAVTWGHIALFVVYFLLGGFGYFADSGNYDSSTFKCRNRYNFFVTDYENADGNLLRVAKILVAFSLLLTVPVDCLVASTMLKKIYNKLSRVELISIETDEYDAISIQPTIGEDLLRPSDVSTVTSEAISVQPVTGCLSPVSNSKKMFSIQERVQREQTTNLILGRSNSNSRPASTVLPRTSIRSSISGSDAAHWTESVKLNESVNPDELWLGDDVEQRVTVDLGAGDTMGDDANGGFSGTRASLIDIITAPTTLHSTLHDVIPGCVIWVVGMLLCLTIEKWVVPFGIVGMMCSSFLMLLLPSMIYFRVGALSDYQASPFAICNIIPNRLFMLLVQIFGLLGVCMSLGLLLLEFVKPTEVNNFGYSDDFVR